jgi:hypothetical protein
MLQQAELISVGLLSQITREGTVKILKMHDTIIC